MKGFQQQIAVKRGDGVVWGVLLINKATRTKGKLRRGEKIEKVTPTSGKIKAKHSDGKIDGDESIFFYIGSIFLSFFAAESSPCCSHPRALLLLNIS